MKERSPFLITSIGMERSSATAMDEKSVGNIVIPGYGEHDMIRELSFFHQIKRHMSVLIIGDIVRAVIAVSGCTVCLQRGREALRIFPDNP